MKDTFFSSEEEAKWLLQRMEGSLAAPGSDVNTTFRGPQWTLKEVCRAQ